MAERENNPSQGSYFDSACKSLFVVGSLVILFAALRNSITWHFQQFWGASHDFWQRLWGWICDQFNDDCFVMSTAGLFLATFIFFWSLNGFFLMLDLFDWPKRWFLQYKIQEEKNMPLDRKRLGKAIYQVLFNQIIIGLPVLLAIQPLLRWRGCNCSRELPTFHWVLFEMTMLILVEEVGFYYSHRLLHHPKLYRHIHKVHHEWTAPIGIIAIYAHPVEHLLSNVIPPAVGVLLMGSHLATQTMWFCLALASATNAHCGYHLPFFPSPEAHDFHHLKFNQCYGVLGVLDRLHGTDNLFRNSKLYQRHIMSLSLVPLKRLFPDHPPPAHQLKPNAESPENPKNPENPQHLPSTSALPSS